MKINVTVQVTYVYDLETTDFKSSATLEQILGAEADDLHSADFKLVDHFDDIRAIAIKETSRYAS